MSAARASIPTSTRLAGVVAFLVLVLGGAWLTARWIAQSGEVESPSAIPVASASPSEVSPSMPQPPAAAGASSPSPSVRPTATEPLKARVLFATNSHLLSPKAKADLNRIAVFVTGSRTAFVVIQGHSDGQGSAAAKLAVSRARAHAVEDYLLDQGVPRSQVSHTPFSDTAPAATGTAPADAAMNRRVDVLVRDSA